ncbi:MAG TPA: YdcF family protein [Opitutaceae bacterium]
MLRFALGIGGAGVASVVLAVVFREPMLRGLADAWVDSDEPAASDAIVILAGSIESRPHSAAALYHRGLAPKLLLTDIPAREGLETPGIDYASGTLMMEGVPREAIILRRSGAKSTFDEARAVAGWAASTGADKLLVVTDPFHTRRTRWIFRRVFQGHGIEIRVVAADPVDYQLDSWWESEFGLIEFNNEVVKYLYYRFRY